MIDLKVCFNVIEIPPSVKQMITDGYPPSAFGSVSYTIVTGRTLGERLPGIIPWLVRQGYHNNDFTLLLRVTPDEPKKMEIPVAQCAVE